MKFYLNTTIRSIFFLIILKTIINGEHRSDVISSRNGEIIIRLSLDTVIVNKNSLTTIPGLSNEKAPGIFSLPKDVIPLLNVPKDAKIFFKRSDPILLKNFNAKINPYETLNIGLSKKLENFQNNQRRYLDDIYIEQSKQINGEEVTLLHINVIKKIKNNWYWFKDTNVHLTWNERKIAKTLSQYLIDNQHPIRNNLIQLEQDIPEYMTSNNLIEINIDSDGYYRIPLDSLEALDPSIENEDLNTLQLFYDGVEQVIDVDTQLGLIFFGEDAPAPPDADYDGNFYGKKNSYWLTWGSNQGLRYEVENVYPSQDETSIQTPISFTSFEKFESNEKLIRIKDLNTNEEWDSFEHFYYHPTIYAQGNENFNLLIPDPFDDGSYSLEVKLQGIIPGLRRVNITLNSRLLGSIEWSGNTPIVFKSNEFSNTDLTDGFNQLNLSVEDLDGVIDQIALDWIKIKYDRKYTAKSDVLKFSRDGDYFSLSQFNLDHFTDPEIVLYKIGETRLEDFIRIQSDDMWTIVFQDQVLGQSQEYFASTIEKLPYPSSIKRLEPLFDIHLEQSNYVIIAPDSFRQILDPIVQHYDAIIKTPETIYRTYSNGVKSPYAIKQFLMDAYLFWSLVPEYLLIAQDISIPAMFILTEEYGASISDYWYSLLNGDDYVPEISTGRFPASNRSELEIMVHKNMNIINNDDQTWENSVLMIAGYDNEFRTQTEELIPDLVKKGYFPERLYVDMFSEGGPHWGNTDSLIQVFEEGVSYINFFGHGGGAVWGDRSLFTLNDFSNLNNSGKLPFVTSMTCFTGDINNPNALGKKMLSHQNGGAYGWFGASGVGWTINDYLLLEKIHGRLFGDHNFSESIGKLINQSKVEYFFENTIWPEIALSQLFQFNLIGDPALTIQNYNSAEAVLGNYSIYSDSKLNLNINNSNIDSLMIQWLDQDYLPLTGKTLTNETQIDLPDNVDSTRIRLVGVYKDENNHNNQFSLSAQVDDIFIEIKDISPEFPVIGDSVSFTAHIGALENITRVECWVDSIFYTNMIEERESEYTLENKIFTSPALSNFMVNVKVFTSDSIFTWSSSVFIKTVSELDVRPIFMGLPTSSKVGLSNLCINKSNGFGLYRMSLDVQWDQDTIYTTLYHDSSYINPYEQITKEIELPLRSGNHRFRVSIENYRKILQDTTYNFDTTLLINRFLITPAHGTTENLITNDTIQYNSLNLHVDPDIVTENEILFIDQIDRININRQNSLMPILGVNDLQPIRIHLSKDIKWESFWTLNNKFDEDTLLFEFNNELKLWKPVEGTWLNNKFLFNGVGSIDIAWMQSNDITPPILEATIDGQRLTQGAYIGTEPEIRIYLRDESGIDLANTKYFKNGYSWDTEGNVDINQNGHLTSITLTPNLSLNDRSISFITSDIMGNISDTLDLKFFVTEDMEIFDYGNFPNPFSNQTIFSYELTRTVDDFYLTIYTVDGRKIKEFKNSVFNDRLNYSGYHEISWDGRDDWGDEVANGIYFYKYTFKYEDKKFSSIGKVGRSK